MTTMPLVLVLLIATAAGVFATIVAHRIYSSVAWNAKKAEPVLVELVDGRTVEGLRVATTRGWVTLIAARTFTGDGNPVSVDGNMSIPRGQVAWIIDGFEPK